MEKYLVTIEFRYLGIPKNEFHSSSMNKKVTIGIFDEFEDAWKGGNKILELLESKFKLHVFPNGKGEAKKERFSKNGGAFGSKNNLITDLAYLKTPFSFFAKITTLKLDSVEESIDEVLSSVKNYKEFKILNEED